jgi:hypothetical protein
MKIESQLEAALEKLARSSWGVQGVGFCKDSRIAVRLFALGFASPVRGKEQNVCRVTLDGFRYLAARRWEETLAPPATNGKGTQKGADAHV